MVAAGPLFFASPEQAADEIGRLAARGDWATLSRYFDLAGADIDPIELQSGAWFAVDPAAYVGPPVPALSLRFPFASCCRLVGSVTEGDAARLIYHCRVVLGDEESAPGRRQTKATLSQRAVLQLRRCARGWRLLPEVTSEPHGGPPLTAEQAAAMVAACLANLGDGNLRLGCFTMDAATFALQGVQDLAEGLWAYRFQVRGRLQGPAAFAAAEEPSELDLQGEVVVDDQGQLALDAGGWVRFAPWRCLAPAHWRTGVEALPEAVRRVAPRSALMTGDAVTRAVWQKVQACMNNLVGGSGHLGSYTLDAASFAVTAAQPAGYGLTAYTFTVRGTADTEFSGGGAAGLPEPRSLAEHLDWLTNGVPCAALAVMHAGAAPETLAGTIVLDDRGELTRDEQGRIRIAPWRCLDPALWSVTDQKELPAAWRPL